MISIEELNQIIETLPKILNYIVPGYLFIVVYNFMMFKDYSYNNSKLFPSIVISYLISLISNIILSDCEPSTVFTLSIGIAIVSAYFISQILCMKRIKIILNAITHRTVNVNVWRDMIDFDGQYRFFLEGKDEVLEGQIIHYEENSHHPYFEVSHYRVLNHDCTEVIRNYNPFLKDNELQGAKERTVILEATKVKYIVKTVMD